MPKRVIDFDAMWGSDKLASCAAWAQAEYAWLYGLADASGCFELTNLRVIWGRVAAIRGNLTIERLEQIFAEFQDKGLLFVWEHEGKRYAHWTGSDVPGRLPPPSWRMRLEKFAPPVPKQQLAEYMARFARGRAALAGGGFHWEAQRGFSNRKEDLNFEISDLKEGQGRGGSGPSGQLVDRRLMVTDRGVHHGNQNFNLDGNGDCGERFADSQFVDKQDAAAAIGRNEIARQRRGDAGGSEIKERLEGAQGQDLGLDRNLDGDWEMERDRKRKGAGEGQIGSGAEIHEEDFKRTGFHISNAQSNSNPRTLTPKELAVARELRVGQGPVCGPARVKPEVLERIRRREAARAGSRSP